MGLNIEDLREQAESGSHVAQCLLGVCYLDGTDVAVDYKQAFRLLSEAASNGVSRAILSLARMYAEGLGITQNVAEATRLYKSVAKVEFLAAIELGRIYSSGVAVGADRNQARQWYLLATEYENRVGDCEEIREAKAYLATEN